MPASKKEKKGSGTRNGGGKGKKILANILAVLLLPVAVALTTSLVGQIASINRLSEIQGFLLAGIMAYMILDGLFFRPLYIYVLGHELTHVFSAWLCGGRVKSFKVSSSGGQVTTTKTNLFISLAPYLVPLYTIILCLAFFLTRLFYKPIDEYQRHFIFLVGFSWSFHLVLTAHFLKTQQPDLTRWGYLFSVVIVYMVNLIILALLLKPLFDQFALKDFFLNAFHSTKEFYLGAYRQLFL